MIEESCELGELELEPVIGGSGDANDPVGTVTGAVDVDHKATPVVL